MTQIILEQGTRGDHGSIREAGVAGERLKEGLELEMGSEGVPWPLCGELLQLVPDSFGGHRETQGDDQRSFKLMQKWRPGWVRVGQSDSSFRSVRSAFQFSAMDETEKKLSRALSGCTTNTRLRSMAAVWHLQWDPFTTVDVTPKSASLGDTFVGFALDISPLSVGPNAGLIIAILESDQPHSHPRVAP